MKLKFLLIPLLLLVGFTSFGQNLISVSFSNGFVGDNTGTNDASNAVYLNSLGWSNIQFSQNSSGNLFTAQGNDVPGNVLITDNSNVQHSIPGFIKWRSPSGNNITTMVFQPSASATLATNSGTYSITTSKYIGLTFNGSTLTISGGVVTGNAAGVLGALNDYYTSQPKFSVSDVTVNEGAGTVTVTVTLSASSSSATTIQYSTSDNTATQPGDYSSTSGSLTFNAGVLTRTFTIPIINDVASESSETFNVTLSNSIGASISDNTGIVTITDNDGGGTISSSGTLSTFTTCAGIASAEQSFSISGTGLTTDLVVTAPTGYEVSRISGGTFTSSVSITPSGATVASTTIYIRLKSDASSAGALQVVLSSTGASDVNVATGISTVNALPTVTATTDGARSGTGTVSLSGTASSGATLDWYAGSSGGSALSGGTGTLSFTTASISATTLYYAQARNTTSGCISTARTPVTATVNAALAAGSIGGTQSICSGSTPTTLTSSTAASGGTGTQTYQWQVSTDNSSFSDITSANAATYSPSALTQTTYYRRGVSTGIDAVTYTTSITVTVNALPTVTATTDGARSGTGTVSLSGTASSGATLDWYADPTGGSVISGGSGVLTFTTPSISATTIYYAQARNTTSGCISAARTPVTATVNAALAAGSIGGIQSTCSGSTPSTLTSSTAASGGTGAQTYQWQVSTDNTNFTDISSANAATYSPGALTQTTYYRRGVSTGIDPVIYTSSITVTVNALPTVTATTDGARSGTGTVSLSGTASTGATLDWYAGSSGGSALSGGTGTLSFTTPSISTTTIYYAQARNTTSECISAARTPVTATVNAALAAGSIGGIQSICSGSTPSTLTSSTAASGGTGAQTYQWQVSTDNTNFTDISSANAATYSPGALTQTTYYRRGVSTGIDAVVYTSSVAVTVSPTSVAGTISAGSATLCYNESTLLSLTGSTGNIQWQSSPDGTNWTDIPSATNTTYNTGNLTTTTRYRAVVTSGVCSAATTALAQTITVNPEIIISGTASISRAITSQLASTGTPATLNAWVSSDITVATISSTGLVTPIKDGTTNITYTQSNGCSKTILFTVLTTDTDGDGVPDDKETLDGTDPNDGCSFKPASRILTPSDSWKSQDCDGDGISNFMECNLSNFLLDTDGDGVPNFLDGDSDNDGIPDNVERNVDSDGDRIADYQDLDSDNDGIGDTFEKGSNGFKPVDTDKDGRPDYLDLDADGDGLLDTWELLDVYAPGQDKDLNGIADVNGAIVDKNGNGWLDILENYRPTDTDKDGKPDYQDLDSDNDNISDTTEGTKDTDNDRRVNFRDADSDGDGIGDIVEGQTDSDKDGIANYLDLDSDGDGIFDSLEGVNRCPTCKEGVDNAPDGWEDSSQFPTSGNWVIDTDKDGTPDYLDLDSDNDGIPDAVEAGATPSNPVDTDKDGIYDFRDLDSDNDGTPDAIEAGKDPANPIDTDKDGTPDYQDVDSDNDGIPDAVEAGKDPANPVDTDKDGTPDYQDLDSDNDGIPDAVEAGKNPVTPVDTDKDGTPDFQDLDSDNDGIPDAVEAGKDPANPIDTDKDGTPDYQDLDSDNDGIPDAVEAGKDPSIPVDTDKDGLPDYQDLDSDNDGIPDAVEAGKNPATPVDTDKDGMPDYQDLDSDNDGIPDAVEAGKNPAMPVDTDKDGMPDYQDLDSDNDGVPDAIEAGKDPSIPVDTDKDGMPDYQDLDSDNDGISDKIEAGADPKNPLDTDKDGIYDFRELDSDNDGLADKLEAGSNPNNPVDTDGDGLPDYRDLESDGDGIPDKIEAGANPASPLDTDGDGTFDFRDLDSDGDGLSDRTEAGANPNAPVDTDADGKPDFQDIDSDGDGLLDRLEDDVNFGALPDCDRDGIPNRIDKDVCETYLTQGFSPNGDGVNDTFVIPGLAGMGNNKLTVFNRWGNIVFEADNYKNDWGGKTNNAFDPLASDGLLPDGMYYYVIDFNGSRPAMSNYLFINRLAK